MQAADAKMDKQPFKSYGELSNMRMRTYADVCGRMQAADAKMDKQPFKSYGELSNMGVKIDSLDLADPAALKAALR
jgi:hypothetical protein